MWDLRWRSGKENHPSRRYCPKKAEKNALTCLKVSPLQAHMHVHLTGKSGKHSFQTFAFKASVELPGLSFAHLKEDVLVQRFFSSFQAFNKNFKHLNVCKWNVESFNQMPKSH